MIFAGFFIAVMFLMIPKSYSQAVASFDAIILSSSMPPQMPDLEQPPCPQAGQLWQPGYWAFDSVLHDYYWVPGDWVAPPQDDLVWTPGYWEFANGLYDFHPGYWGTDVGFYGGINYGFGYFGAGYSGGTWKHHHFHYNTAVTHVDKKVVHDTYVDNTVVVTNVTENHISFNGSGGIIIKPRPEEERAMREYHYEPTQVQIAHFEAARDNRSQFVSINHGRPATNYLNKANTKTFITEATRNPIHNGSGANPGTSANTRTQNNLVNHSSHTGNNLSRQQHTSQHNSQQRQANTQQHLSAQHHTQQRSNRQAAQHTTQQRSNQHVTQQQRQQQYHIQQKTPQFRTQQQHAQQPHVQQQRLPQLHVQPKAQQPKTQLLPHQKHT